MKVVIMAGGKGTRMANFASSVPKPMLTIAGKPILEHQIDRLKRQGITEFILIIGYLGEIIKTHFGDGSQFGVTIRYIEEKQPLGTAGALFYLKGKVKEDILLVNGDLIFDIEVWRFLSYHKEKKALVTLFTHPNNHPYDSAILMLDDKGRIVDWLHKEEKRGYYANRVNAGIHLLSPQILELFTEEKKLDLDRDILKPLLPGKQIYAYDSPEYVMDVGTPERFSSTEQDMMSGNDTAKNLGNRQKAVFLDRDGTINQANGFLTKLEQFVLIEGAAEAIRKINKSGCLAIVVTNQPVIARGDCTIETLKEIHNKMETLLGEQGAFLDSIFFCPHHPDRGFEGERKEYKISCECRKPKPGMLLQAAKKFNIDLSASYMIGDDERDILAGKAAGCQSILLSKIGTSSIQEEDLVYPDLLTCITEVFS